MSYEEKLDAIIEEIEGLDRYGYPKDIIDKIRDEILEEQRKFLEEKLAEDLDRFDWWRDGDGAERAREYFIERMLVERLTPEERAEGEAIEKAQAMRFAQIRLDQALEALEKTQESVEEATRLRKPRLLRHYTELRQLLEAEVDRCKAELAKVHPA